MHARQAQKCPAPATCIGPCNCGGLQGAAGASGVWEPAQHRADGHTACASAAMPAVRLSAHQIRAALACQCSCHDLP